MIAIRQLEHSDYDDIVEMTKDIWDGTDYLPGIFHEWVDEGYFIGAIDTATDKVVGVDKYTVLPDKSGWLEGLRVHKYYRGQGISKLLAAHTLDAAMKDLQSGRIARIAYGTHITSVESINLMKKHNFHIKQQYLLVTKSYSKTLDNLSLRDFRHEKWTPSYEEVSNMKYLRKRNNILPFTFIFQEMTPDLYRMLLNEECFVIINGHKGIYKFKGEPHFAAFEDTFEAIDTFMSYYLLLNKASNMTDPLTSVICEEYELINKLKSENYTSLADWQPDYLYFSYEI